MHRLFVAIRPPRAVREQLLATMGGVPGARWQNDEQLHLTLRFVGEVERPVAEDVAGALDRVRTAPFDLRVQGVGRFERRGRTDTIWAGVAPQDDVAALARKINEAVTKVGLPTETRAFRPHITLARLGRGATAPAEPFLQRAAGLTSPPWRADSFCLYESTLASEGARYEAIARYVLA